METSFLWFGVFSGSFGVRSIVLCKCSGKYIDIYFKLKITYSSVSIRKNVALWCSGSALASHARGPGFNSRVG